MWSERDVGWDEQNQGERFAFVMVMVMVGSVVMVIVGLVVLKSGGQPEE